jgi:hypothetical protein
VDDEIKEAHRNADAHRHRARLPSVLHPA